MTDGRIAPPLRSLDKPLCAAALLLLFVGMLALYSISHVNLHRFTQTHFQIHCLYITVAFSLFAIGVWLPLQFWRKYMLAFITLALLACVLALFSDPINGAKRWLRLGPLTVQVTEVMKFAALLAFACWGKVVVEGNSFINPRVRAVCFPLIPLLLFIVVAALLLLLQRDFGTLVLLVVTAFTVVLLAGLPWRYIILLLLIVAVIGPLLILSESYRVARVTAFLDPFEDPQGKGYAQLHSLMAYSNGGWWGAGAGNSLQKFRLPEVHNDFIAAIIAEEYGWLVFFLVCMAYLLITLRIIAVAHEANRRGELFGAFYAYALSVLFLVQATVNIGGSLAALPSKGFTLPLVSYGGTSLCVTAVMLAVVMRIDYENKQAAAQRRALL